MQTSIFLKKTVPWMGAALLFAGAVIVALRFAVPLLPPAQVAIAAVVALFAVAALHSAVRALAGRDSDVIEHGPEMSSLAFPPSSFTG